MRRAQVTLFVLLGLAILLAILLFFGLRHLRSSAEDSLSAEETAPVEQLILSCSEQSLERLLRIMGSQGGQLDLSGLKSNPLVWESETVPLGPQRVPYWSHVTGCENPLGCEASAQPPLCEPGACTVQVDRSLTEGLSVQRQLERALPEAVLGCLDNFTTLGEQFTVKQEGDGEASLLIGEEDVRAILKMPFRVTEPASGRTRVLDEFSASADLALPRLYRLANDIANAEREHTFLEGLTLHLISVYSGVDAPLPPMRALTLLGEKRYWTRSNVEQVLREEVLPWTNLIQVPNARAGYVPLWPVNAGSLSEDEQVMYAGIMAPLTVVIDNRSGSFHDDLRAEFLYPDERPYLSINGGQELLAPRSAEIGGFFQKLIGVFLNDYRFRYDLSYPVIVTLTDESAFQGRQYSWSFALEANIRKNEALNRSAAVSSFQLIDASIDAGAPQQRLGMVTARALDARTGKVLDGVRISYACGEEIYIGETDAEGLLRTGLPYCRYGGTLLYSREGYAGSGTPLDNYLDEERSVDLRLWPLQEVSVTVQKRNGSGLSPLGAEDLVIVNLARIKAEPEDEDVPLLGYFTLSVASHDFSVDIAEENRSLQEAVGKGILTKEEAAGMLAELQERADSVVPAQPSVTLALAPGNYTLEAYLIRNGNFTVPEEKRKYSSGLFSSKTVTLPAQNFTTWMSGGASLNESQPFTVSTERLYASENLTLFVLEQPLPRTWKLLEEYKTLEEYQLGRRNQLEPAWS